MSGSKTPRDMNVASTALRARAVILPGFAISAPWLVCHPAILREAS